MYKGRDIIGKPIVSYDMGEKFETVEDLIFDQDSNQLLGFVVKRCSSHWN
ncbi:PRC-barrel domain-containing protein [Crocosphaera sp. XPORK-15E]